MGYQVYIEPFDKTAAVAFDGVALLIAAAVIYLLLRPPYGLSWLTLTWKGVAIESVRGGSAVGVTLGIWFARSLTPFGEWFTAGHPGLAAFTYWSVVFAAIALLYNAAGKIGRELMVDPKGTFKKLVLKNRMTAFFAAFSTLFVGFGLNLYPTYLTWVFLGVAVAMPMAFLITALLYSYRHQANTQAS